MDTNNIKSLWPMPAPCVGDPTPPIFHLLALGVGVGDNANFSVRVGGNANLSIFRYQHIGVSPMRNCGVGGLSQREDPSRMVLHRSGI